MRTQVGQALREARLQRGLDLYEVKRVTKISVPVLRAMEEDRWDDVPAPGAEALLDTYARFLGLDEGSLAAEPRSDQRHPGWHRRGVLLVIGFAAVVGLVIGLVAVGPLGGGGDEAPNARTAAQTTTTTATTASAPVSVELRTNALVWVCLVDQRGRPVINGLNLVRDQTVGPYDGKAFDVTFGNGKIDLTVNGQPVKVPAIAAPLGYRITRDGATRLAPRDRPTCA
jgi:transcriptional regulator with XRE-family HTH domain